MTEASTRYEIRYRMMTSAARVLLQDFGSLCPLPVLFAPLPSHLVWPSGGQDGCDGRGANKLVRGPQEQVKAKAT